MFGDKNNHLYIKLNFVTKYFEKWKTVPTYERKDFTSREFFFMHSR